MYSNCQHSATRRGIARERTRSMVSIVLGVTALGAALAGGAGGGYFFWKKTEVSSVILLH